MGGCFRYSSTSSMYSHSRAGAWAHSCEVFLLPSLDGGPGSTVHRSPALLGPRDLKFPQACSPVEVLYSRSFLTHPPPLPEILWPPKVLTPQECIKDVLSYFPTGGFLGTWH